MKKYEMLTVQYMQEEKITREDLQKMVQDCEELLMVVGEEEGKEGIKQLMMEAQGRLK